ncbi:MAG: carboxypeptidase regulatory-like domain-containing protein, partial [candidate division Zixibacteria bacterium]|nr:carboxypeptidase regulatory-like domain-containing protein [candidate division Zixibacteria bacterium]
MRHFLTGLLLIVVIGCSSNGPNDPPEPIRYGDVSGTVYLEGTAEPLSGVEVRIADRSDTTAGGGVYEIDSIPEGSHSLTASHADYETYERTVEVTGKTVHDIQLSIAIETGSLHGHVLHPVYGPVSGARILIADSLDYSDINGAYSLANIPVGLQTLTCTQPGSYHDFVGSLYITNSDNEYDITMIR